MAERIDKQIGPLPTVEPGETHSDIEARMEQREKCEVCRARAVLAEDYPGAIEREVKERKFQGFPIPEDLFTVE